MQNSSNSNSKRFQIPTVLYWAQHSVLGGPHSSVWYRLLENSCLLGAVSVPNSVVETTINFLGYFPCSDISGSCFPSVVFMLNVNGYCMHFGTGASYLGCLRKWLLEFRESRNFIRKWSYFREISSNFVYFRITFYTTFRIIWHDFHTKFCIPSNKNLTNNKCLWNLGLYFVLILYKNKKRQKL